jgi:hypothetical protein
MKKLLIMIALLLCFSIVGCTPSDEQSGASDSNVGNNTMNSTYSFKTLEEMRSFVPSGEGDVINLLGYYAAGDAGSGQFYWDADCEDADNGGTIIKPNGTEKGRFIRLKTSNNISVAWFGANGNDKNDDTAFIKNALSDLKNGGTLTFEPGNYLVSEALEVKVGGVKIAGVGSVTLTATGKMEGVIVVDSVSDVSVCDINIIGSGKADSGISVKGESKNVSMKTVSIAQFAKIGLNISGNVTGGIYEEVNVVSAKPSSVGLSVSGGANDIVFTACTFDMLNASKCSAGEFKYTHDITFQNCTFTTKSVESNGTVFVGGEKEGYPKAIGFYSCDVFNVKVNEDDGAVGKNHFFGFMTHNGQSVPKHEKIFGSTDDGTFFGLS